MASRVNTKFVVLLAGALLVLFVGVAGLAAYMHFRSGDRLIAKGDRAMAQQDYEEASKMYSRAVNKDQSRPDWLEKWKGALLKTVPKTPAAYQKAYRENYLGLLNRVAVLNPTDPEAQLALVREFEKSLGASLSAAQSLASTVDERARQLDPTDPKTQELLAHHGRAVVDQMLRIDVDDEEAERAHKELEEAVAADPDDWESALALVKYQYAKVVQYRRDVRGEEAQKALDEFEQKLAELVENYAQYPEVHTFKFGIEASELRNKAVTAEAKRQAQETLSAKAKQTLDAVAEADADLLTAKVIAQLSGAIGRFLDEDGQQELHALLGRVVEARPDDAMALLYYGQSFSNIGEYAKAFDTFERVDQLPDKTLSYEGLLLPAHRRAAVQAEVDLLLTQYVRSEDKEEQADLLAKAKDRLEKLRSLSDVNSEMDVKLREAQIALIENDNAKAVILLDDIRRNLRDDNPRVLRLLAQALQGQGNLGEAVRQYERLISSGQATPRDLVAAGDYYLQLNDPEQAEAMFRQALRLQPDFEYAQNRLNAILQMSASAEDQTLDPIVKALVNAKKMSSEGDTAGALSVLEQAAADAPNDMRLIRELVALDVASDNRDRAVERVDAAIERMPDRRELRVLHDQLTIEDPIELAETVINTLDLTPVQREIQRVHMYDHFELEEKADAAFKKAEDLDPDNPVVIETGFIRALRRAQDDGFAEAERYVARATEKNADRIGGLTFKGRLELAKGDSRAAEATFTRAVEKSELSPMAWRYLGQAQRLNGKIEAALQSMARAYQGRPDHRGIAEDYARVLVMNQKGEEALKVTRKLLASGTRTPELVDFWLSLEAEYGDRDQAMTSRRSIFESDPTNLRNGISYLGLLLEDENYDAYEAALDTLEEAGTLTSLQVADSRARGLAQRDEIEKARQLLNDYVDSVPKDELTVDMFLTIGRFERQFGTLESAIAAYEKGRPFEDPNRLEVDRAVGDLLFAAAQAGPGQAAKARSDGDTEEADRIEQEALEHYERSAEAYRAIHEANRSDDGVTKRLAETLINLDRFSEAEKALASIGNDDDLQVLLLRSVIAKQTENPREARSLLDRAVELYPNDPITYFRRAQLNANEPSLFPDVIADLDQVTRLRPGMLEAWNMKFGLYVRRHQIDEAFAKLTAAIAANPDNDRLKSRYVELLWATGQLAKQKQAKAEAQKFADKNWDDTDWLERAALLSYQLGSYGEATRYYKRLYEIDPSPLGAVDLLNAWFRSDDDPPLPEVNRMLRTISELEETKPEITIPKKMLMARAQQWLGKATEADKLCVSAFKDASETSARWLVYWFQDLRLRFETDETTGMNEAFAFIREHASELNDGELPPIIKVLVIRNDALNGIPAQQCLERLNAMADQIEGDATTELEFHRLENQLYYQLGDYQKCADACRAGLEINNQDLELNNNLAYTLAKHLEDPEAALPYAEQAARIASDNAAVLDTLGWVYFESERYRDADQVLDRAIVIATGPDELVPAHLHLAQSKLATGDRTGARKSILKASEGLKRASQAIKDQYGEDVRELFKELNP